jgi:hypothetical protein
MKLIPVPRGAKPFHSIDEIDSVRRGTEFALNKAMVDRLALAIPMSDAQHSALQARLSDRDSLGGEDMRSYITGLTTTLARERGPAEMPYSHCVLVSFSTPGVDETASSTNVLRKKSWREEILSREQFAFRLKDESIPPKTMEKMLAAAKLLNKEWAGDVLTTEEIDIKQALRTELFKSWDTVLPGVRTVVRYCSVMTGKMMKAKIPACMDVSVVAECVLEGAGPGHQASPWHTLECVSTAATARARAVNSAARSRNWADITVAETAELLAEVRIRPRVVVTLAPSIPFYDLRLLYEVGALYLRPKDGRSFRDVSQSNIKSVLDSINEGRNSASRTLQAQVSESLAVNPEIDLYSPRVRTTLESAGILGKLFGESQLSTKIVSGDSRLSVPHIRVLGSSLTSMPRSGVMGPGSYRINGILCQHPQLKPFFNLHKATFPLEHVYAVIRPLLRKAQFASPVLFVEPGTGYASEFTDSGSPDGSGQVGL